MPLPTFGSQETLLKLFQIYCGYTNRPIGGEILLRIWKEIAEHVQNGGGYRFYPKDECDPAKPGPSFLDDIQKLIIHGFLKLDEDGVLFLTPLGWGLVRQLSVPKTLTTVGEQVAQM